MASTRSDELETGGQALAPREPRRRTLLGARVVFNNGNSTVDCQVRDVAEHGARLSLHGTVTLPDEFELHFLQQGDARRVRVVWQRGANIGVRYLDDPRETRNKNAEVARLAEIRELKAEVARLQARILELVQG
jgi:hypothetical protein